MAHCQVVETLQLLAWGPSAGQKNNDRPNTYYYCLYRPALGCCFEPALEVNVESYFQILP